MTDAITASVTWADLTAAYTDELNDLKDAYDELLTQAHDEYGDGWQTTPATDDTHRVYQQQAQQYDKPPKAFRNANTFSSNLNRSTATATSS